MRGALGLLGSVKGSTAQRKGTTGTGAAKAVGAGETLSLRQVNRSSRRASETPLRKVKGKERTEGTEPTEPRGTTGKSWSDYGVGGKQTGWNGVREEEEAE